MNGPDTFTSRGGDQPAPGSDIMSMIQNLWFDEHQHQAGAQAMSSGNRPENSRSSNQERSPGNQPPHQTQQALSVDDLYMTQFFPCVPPTSSASTGDLASINNGSQRADMETRPHSSQFGPLNVGVSSPPGLSGGAGGFSPLPHHSSDQVPSSRIGGSSILNQNLENLLKTFTQQQNNNNNSGNNCFTVPDISPSASSSLSATTNHDAYRTFHSQSSFLSSTGPNGSSNSSNSGHFMASAPSPSVTSNVVNTTGDIKHQLDLLSQFSQQQQQSRLTQHQLPKSGPTTLSSSYMSEQSNCSTSKMNLKQHQHSAAVQQQLQQQHSSIVPDINKTSPPSAVNLRTNHLQQQPQHGPTILPPYLSANNPVELAAAIINHHQNASSPLGPSISSPNNGSSFHFLSGGGAGGCPSSTTSTSSSLLDHPSLHSGFSSMAILDDRLSSPFGNVAAGDPFGPRISAPKSIVSSGSQAERFESQMNMISSEIQSTIQTYVNGLNSRKEQLLQQLETVRKIYSAIFVLQSKSETGAIGGPSSPPIVSGGQVSVTNINFTKPDITLLKAVSAIGFITVPAFAPFCSVSGDGLDVTVPGLNSSFVIHTKNCFQEELMVGHENVNVKIVALCDGGSNLSSDHQASSHGNVPPSTQQPASYSSAVTSNELLSASSLNEAISRSVSVTDHNNGRYTVLYSVPPVSSSRNVPNWIEIHVVINGLVVQGSPFRVKVMKQNKSCSWSKAMNYGTEGNAIGQLCRPWGVAIARMPPGLVQSSLNMAMAPGGDDQQQHSNTQHPLLSPQSPFGSSPSSASNGKQVTYLVAVADRSNNRVQLFSLDMATKQMIAFQVFGSGPGTRNGQFDRPAGICINLQLNQVIIADKDNHRIQVFDLKGNFLFKFGEKGNRIGQFCYPWDVDSCPVTHEIAVSDTRNRRVQLFDSSGRYLSYFAQPLDSPRGVSFLADSKLLVSDFNKHRLLIFDRKNHGHLKHLHSSAPTTPTPPPSSSSSGTQSSTRFIGFGEGSGWGEFLRPQGTSFCGNFIFCSDSRNNRVCIYNLSTQSFEYLFDDLNLDRPSGIAVLDNVMIVTDFGNNRLQIFQQH